MKANETKLQHVIEGMIQYVVPLFQRRYSWGTPEWNTLWEDLFELHEEGVSQRSHFIGSIVTMPTQSVPEGVGKFLLIDGQQRFTTIFILLAALRDKAKLTPESTLSQEIEQTLLRNPFRQGNDGFKLLPTQGDREALLSIIRGEAPESEDQITRSYKFFERKIRSFTILDLEEFKHIVVTRLVLVSIVLERDDNPHLVFESLNAKGRALSQADLIRNYFFMRIHVDDQERLYAAYWTPMQDRLGENLTEFIRHFLMRNGGVVKEGEVYCSLKNAADNKRPEEIVEFLKEIAGYAQLYAKLLDPGQEPNLKIRREMQRLNRIVVTTAYPFLLNVYHDFSSGRRSDDDFAEIIRLLENFMIRRFVCGVPTWGLNKVFSALYSQSNQHPSNVAGLKEALRTKHYPHDLEFRERFVSTKLYGGGERVEKTKIILERLEESFEHREPVPFAGLQIEHVLPQTLTQSWKDALGEDWETVHDLLLHTVGNLTLTGYNAPLSNDDYNRKRQILGKSHLELNKYFENVAAWNEQAIRDRAEVLADRALMVWGYFGQEQGAPDAPEEPPQGNEQVDGAELDNDLIERLRQQVGSTFGRLSRARYESLDGVRLAVLLSRAHYVGETKRYWFGVSKAQHEFLTASPAPWLAFKCGRSERTLLFPFLEFTPLLARLGTNQWGTWQVDIRDDGERLFVLLREPTERRDVTAYLLPS